MFHTDLQVSPVSNTTVSIELLRQGTPHNQTLSPGVTYLALCGSHPPAEFRINLEHYKFTRYLQLLRYKSGGQTSSIELAREALQDIITNVLEAIPALQVEANASTGWLHLRLVMTPRELAMLPFELALTPIGFQGARSKAFLLNPQRLTTLTREVRQVAPRTIHWPAKPRILYIWADPDKSVPNQEHENSLKAALQTFVRPIKTKLEPEDDDQSLLTVLPHVQLKQLQTFIQEAVLSNNPYTHVHILAHGITIPDPDNGPRFGLALHLEKERIKSDGSKSWTDTIDGEQLADALMVVRQDRFYCPTVVTIAACDAGNEGTVMLPGGSLAHVLHQSGIPYVLASQFPLSQPGSVRLVDEIYPRLLAGEDPRIALYYARKAVDMPGVHDWASLVAYARFPDDLEEQLKTVQLQVALEMMKAANQWTDHILYNGINNPEVIKKVDRKLSWSIQNLEMLLKQSPDPSETPARSAEHLGLLGSAYKRLSEYLFRCSLFGSDQQNDLKERSTGALGQARRLYRQGHDLLLTNHWTATQYLSLTVLFEGTLESEHDRWFIAHFAAINDLQKGTGQSRLWPLGSLAELYLLKPFIVPTDRFEEEKTEALKKAGDYLDELADCDFPFEKESMARQLERYVKWWPDAFSSTTTAALQEMAASLREHLRIVLD